jgi:hypothetical protein
MVADNLLEHAIRVRVALTNLFVSAGSMQCTLTAARRPLTMTQLSETISKATDDALCAQRYPANRTQHRQMQRRV